MNQFQPRLRKLIIFSLAILTISCAANNLAYLTPEARTIHEQFWSADSLIYRVLMKDTPYQTPVFRFQGKKEGPTALILGGTHGDELAGFEAAFRLLKFFRNSTIKAGTVFLVPQANRLADEMKNRRVPVPKGIDYEKGNLNRCYPGKPDGFPMEKLAFEITKLIENEKVGLFIDLHESRFFHQEQKNEKGEYHGLGQTLIYTMNEEATWLGMVTIDRINENIPPGKKRFTLVEGPIKHSGAWSAGKLFHIPGFTVETCRKLPLEERIKYQMQIVKIMLKEFGCL